MSLIRFEILPPVGAPEEPVFVCGNVPALGEWNPERAFALRWEGDAHVGRIPAEIGTVLEYKVLRGGWESEAVDAWGSVPPNSRHEVWLDATVRRTVADWKDRYAGRLMRDRVYSRVLASWRELLIWLPPSYAAEPGRRYPALYFNDGANVFDPETSPLSRVDLAADEWVRALSAAGEMPEAIVVAVCHPEGFAEGMRSLRDVDLSPELGGAAYAQFLVSELVPAIDQHYRTRAEPAARMIGGAGLGALNALFAVVHHPGVFGKFAGLSTLLRDLSGANPGELQALGALTGMDSGARWYFDYGTAPPDSLLAEDHRALTAVLAAKGRAEGRDFRVIRVVNGGHDERSWRVRLGDALRFLWRKEGG